MGNGCWRSILESTGRGGSVVGRVRTVLSGVNGSVGQGRMVTKGKSRTGWDGGKRGTWRETL